MRNDFENPYGKEGRIVMRISVQAHHSFVDGIHVGKFEERLQAHLNGEI